jgi:hypothetical protein
VVIATDQPDRYVVIDGYKRIAALQQLPTFFRSSRRCSACVYTPITSDICATRSNAPAKRVRPADSMGATTRLRRG